MGEAAVDVAASYDGFFSVGECKVPLVLTPARQEVSGNHEALVANREWVEEKVVSNSAVLLRGFGVRDAVEFDAIVEMLGWTDIRYVGPAPREFSGKVILFCEVPPPEG